MSDNNDDLKNLESMLSGYSKSSSGSKATQKNRNAISLLSQQSRHGLSESSEGSQSNKKNNLSDESFSDSESDQSGTHFQPSREQAEESQDLSQSDTIEQLDIPMPETLPDVFSDLSSQNYPPSHDYDQPPEETFINSPSIPAPAPSQANGSFSHLTQNSTPTLQPKLKVVRRSNRVSPDIAKLSTVTYNLWFGEHQLQTRTNQLMKSLLSKKSIPDIMGFQEVTPVTYALIRRKLSQHYYLFDTLGEPPVPYANIMAINKETLELDEESLVYYDYPETQMGRKLMMCKVKQKRNRAEFHIMNTHLESLKENSQVRHSQMEFIREILKAEKIQNCILLGDLNIYEDTEPIESLIKTINFQDSFQEMGSPQSLKYTYDPKQNRYAQGKYRFRADRILYLFQRPPQSDFEVVISKMKLLGISNKAHPYSDHFGVNVEFVIRKVSSTSTITSNY
jgi:endonuclease/exonuclease/phosphatase family metal-dependent hydrolase